MELVSIIEELWQASKRLKESEKKLFKLAEESAKAEREYRKALRHEILSLEIEGKRATIIADLARGQVADIKFERDLAEKKFSAGRDAVKAIIAQASVLQTIKKHQEEI